MLCSPCVAATDGTADAVIIADSTRPWQTRRNAAIRLIATARKRHQKLALKFHD